MKNSFLLTAALASEAALLASAASSGLEKALVDGFMSYAGLDRDSTKPVDLATTLTPEADDELKSEPTPRVKAFGFESANSSDNGLLGYELGINGDIGWSYELPLYN